MTSCKPVSTVTVSDKPVSTYSCGSYELTTVNWITQGGVNMITQSGDQFVFTI